MSVSPSHGDIAIIGMGCRLPGDAKSPSDFYEMLLKKRSGWREVPQDRYNIDSFWHPSDERHGTVTCRGGHFLKDDIGLFDAPFFSMTQAEANAMDPQQRMLLEITYEALENAGLPLSKVVGSDTACFVAGFTRDYDDIAKSEIAKSLLHTTTGNGLTMMSNRLSWFYDLRGPSVSFDTACSSSLVALHMACHAIRESTSDSRQAIIGGTNLMLVPDLMTTMTPLHFLSPDSQCFSFDDRANGYVRGEGISIMVLKHVDDAIRDRDCIRAVIRGTGVNSDGKTPGITLPSSAAQTSLIRKVYTRAGLNPADTGYFEAHGTGTSAGDPLEVGAIASVFDRTSADCPAPLYIGSVKPNIGHLEAGAGLAGLIKTVFILETGVIPPQINFVNANPKLRLEERNFVVPTQATPWPTQGLRRASVNSFGYGGTNAHCVLDDAYHYLTKRGIEGLDRTTKHPLPQTPDTVSTDSGIGLEAPTDCPKDFFGTGTQQLLLFAISAPELNAVPRLGKTLASYLDDKDNLKDGQTNDTLEQLAFTLGSRRSTFQWRTIVVAQEIEDLKNKLRSLAKPARASKPPNLLFCFTGQGAQWYAMGRELLVYEVYQSCLRHADSYLKSIGARWSVLEELDRSKEDSRIGKPEFSQPLCTVIQIALVELLRHWNIQPTTVTGHSSGEIAAAYTMGAISAEDAYKIAFHRGRLAGNLSTIAPQLNGGMMAIGLSEAGIQPYLQKLEMSAGDVLSVACINSPSSITISGDIWLLTRLEGLLKSDSVFARRLTVETAYHSDHMKHLVEAYEKSIEDIVTTTVFTSGVTMISSVTGRGIQPEELGPAYWVSNMVSPVRFANAIESVFVTTKGQRRKKPNATDIVVEIGPHAALQGPIKQILTQDKKNEDVAYFSALRRGEPADCTALQLAGALWSRGADIKFALANSLKAVGPLLIPLNDMPKYPWNHGTRYWHESAPMKSHRFRHSPRTDLLGYPMREFSMLEPRWKNVLYLSELPWIGDHKFRGNDVFPAAGMICAALEGARQIADKSRAVDSFELRDISIARALIIPPADPGVDVFTSFKPQKTKYLQSDMSPWYEFAFSSLETPETKTSKYVEHCRGQIAIHYCAQDSRPSWTLNEDDTKVASIREEYEDVKSNSKVDISKAAHYDAMSEIGFDYGPSFQGLTGAKIAYGQAAFDMEITDTAAIMPAQFEYEHLLHPATLDVGLQSSSLAMRLARGKNIESTVPTGIEQLRVSGQMPKGPSTPMVGFCRARKLGYRDNAATIKIGDPLWKQSLVEIHNLSFTGLGDNNDQLIDDDQAIALRKLCTETHWKADIDLLDVQEDQSHLLPNPGLESWFDLHGHKYPHMKILEVGAGTGAATLPILRTLGGTSGRTPHFSSYCFTDVSNASFEKAQELLQPWQGRLDFKTLDLKEDLIEQGFEAESFDVIVVTNVLHTSEVMNIVPANCFKLLKRGGKLAIGGLTSSSGNGPTSDFLTTQAEWNDRLVTSGFSGLDLSNEASSHLDGPSLMVSSKPIATTAITNLQRVVIIQPSHQSDIATSIVESLKESFSNIRFEVVNLETASTHALAGDYLTPGLSVVSLLESEEHVFARCSETAFESIRMVILNSTRLHWVTCHASKEGVRHPESCAISGLFRVARSENGRLRLQELHLQKRGLPEAADAADLIGRVVKSTWAVEEGADYEDEIVEANRVLTIPRLLDEEHMNRTLQTIGVTPQPEHQQLSSISRPLALSIGRPGLLDTLHFADNTDVLTPLAADEVLVDVQAAALNHDDLLVALGQMPGLTLGIEGAGLVKQTGSSVSAVKAGDRVAFVAPGAISTVIRAKGNLVHALPTGMSLEDGASIPLVFMAAYRSLIEVAHLLEGERVLIQSAAGGLGQAMIQIAQHVGAEIFVTVGAADKRDLLTKQYGIEHDHVFSSRDLSFAKAINRMTKGQGLDVTINTLTGEALRQTWSCIAPFGRFVELGKTNALTNDMLEMKHFSANASFSVVNIQDICHNAPQKATSLMIKVFNLFRLGALKVVYPIDVYDYSDIETAFRTMQSGLHIGKIVLQSSEQSVIPALSHDTHPMNLRPDATYILAGGLGGIGRGLAPYMANHGAKHLAIFSRSGNTRSEVRKVLDILTDVGVEVRIYVCDVTDADAVQRAITRISLEMPPIKGVIHGAMVLRDGMYLSQPPKPPNLAKLIPISPKGLFETLSYEDWTTATGPKIQGSWNLHEHMPHNLDFFIMLSSISGILGNRGQANYCAGNTYQDQLAHYRRSLGLTAQVIDLGAIGGIGVFEENKDNLKIAETMKDLIIKEDEFYALMKAAMTGYSHGDHRLPTQLITGAGSGGLSKVAKSEYYWLNESARMAYLRQLDMHSTLQASTGDDNIASLKSSLTAVSTLPAAALLIQNAVAGKLAKAMMVDVGEIDINRPVASYGVDSLVAAEMRNWCFKELKADISVLELLSGKSISVLAEQVAGRSTLVKVGAEGV
ncbi:MAG: hypothetical protein Q9166_006307 [cf. Caloplaca sp. 2 TL-2023]